MIRTSPSTRIRSLAVFVLVASIQMGCATQYAATHAKDRSPFEQAKLQYTALSLDYDYSMASLEDLSNSHPFTQRQKKILDDAQARVREWTPLVRSSLDAWGQFGEKPANYDATLAHISESLNEVKSISVEVHQ